MSAALERANRAEAVRKISPVKHRDIVIAERNKEIFALKARLRGADFAVKQYRAVLEMIDTGKHPAYKRLARSVLAFVGTQLEEIARKRTGMTTPKGPK